MRVVGGWVLVLNTTLLVGGTGCSRRTVGSSSERELGSRQPISGASSVAALSGSAPPRASTPSAAPSRSASSAQTKTCEVEISGRVVPPKGTKLGPETWVYIAEGDCLSPSVRMLGRQRVIETGAFWTEVFSSWGADLTLCAAVEDADGKTTLYGKSTRVYHAEATGEVMFEHVEIPLKAGASTILARPPGPPP